MLRSTATNRRRGLRLGTTGRALGIIQTPLRCMFAGSVLLGISAYLVFLCLEMFSPQPRAKTCPSGVPHPIGYAPVVAEENLDRVGAETPILVEAESLGEEAVRAPTLPHDSRMPMTLVPVTLESEPTGP